MKKIYLFLFLLFAAATSFGQFIVVTATAGTVGPTNYFSLKSAFDAVNDGTHQGVITITTNGSYVETETATLLGSGGTSSYTAVSIKPTGGIASSISGNIPGPLVDLDGADNVTIDGLNTGGNSLTISNANLSSANPCAIRLINDASGNTIQKTSLSSAGTSAASATVVFSTGTTTGNDNNTITNCDLADVFGSCPVNGIYSSGNVGAGIENSNNTISNNNISNFFNPALATAGIILSTGNSDWIISTNRFFQTAPRTFTAAFIHRAIQVASGNNNLISGNIIGYNTAAGTGVYTMAGAVSSRFIGIDLAVGTVVPSSVQNNTITEIAFTTSNNANLFVGINIAGGSVNVGTITGNIIGRTTGTSSIVLTPTIGGNAGIGVLSTSTGAGIVVTISNNSIGAIDMLPAGATSGTLIGVQTMGASGGTVTVSNNTIGNTTANNLRVGTVGTTTGSGIARGIVNNNAGTIAITGNTIRNLTHNSSSTLGFFRGIECQAGTAAISQNTISNMTGYGTSNSITTHVGVGILLNTNTTAGVIVDQNTIFNLSATNPASAGMVLSGIYLLVTNGVIVTRNNISGFSNASTSASTTLPGIIAGIYCSNANVANPMTIANNMISVGNAQTTNTAFIGIWNHLATANFSAKIYYNSVNIEGTAAGGSQPSFCYYRGDFATSIGAPTVDIRNNIFTNSRSGGTGRHFAIANGYGNATSNVAGWTANASDYNVLNANGATVGYWSGDQGFANWKLASASDEHSLNGVTVDYVNSASNLHLLATANTAINAKATPIAGFTTDFDADTRNATTPDIGADEFTPDETVPILMEYFKGHKQGISNLLTWKASCSSAQVKFDIERSSDGRKFVVAGSFTATQARCAMPFDFADNSPLKGMNYYRLKMMEADGSISYSMIIAIINKESGFEVVGLFPTLVSNGNAVLNVSSVAPAKMEIIVTDMSGKLVQKQQANIVSGSNTISINMQQLASGTYQLSGFTAAGKAATIRFVKL
ncbi:MAG: T9SS type A sorting domain-containing protein [Bacteroidota bacterium]